MTCGSEGEDEDVTIDEMTQQQMQPPAEDSGEEDTEIPRERTYDDDIRAAMPGYELLHETAAAFLPGLVGQRARVLVVGAGSGEEVVRLGRENPGWRFVAEDPSAEMLAVAREKIDAAGLADRVAFVPGPVEAVASDDRCDAATMILVQHFLPDDGAKLSILREIAARLRPGAPLFLANMHGDLAAGGDQQRYQAWKRRQMTLGMSASDAEAMFSGLPTVVHFVSEDRTRRLLEDAGFSDVVQVFRAFMIGGWLAYRL